MTQQPPVRDRARSALDQRLRAVAHEVLGAGTEAPTGSVELLETMVERLQREPDLGRTWLLLTAVQAAFPRAERVREAHRRIRHNGVRDATIWLLRSSAAHMSSRDAVAEIELVTDRPVVDVDFSARHSLLSGIQRVVRSVVPLWLARHRIVLVRWVDDRAMIGLSPREVERLNADPDVVASRTPPRRVVPWRVPVLLLEVPSTRHGDRLSSLARFSPSSLRVVGYDCIPAVSGELVADAERTKFAQYLELVKFTDQVVAISQSAREEFSGFCAALVAQGVEGPEVESCPLPTTVTVPSASAATAPPGVHEVLCVGTLDKRKNQIVVLEAAENLWREGLRFTVRLVGSVGRRSEDLVELIDLLLAAGRPVVVERPPVSDVTLDRAYRSARVVVFPTLHEGYGMPVVEALSYGVPVITSDFGSTQEIGRGQGAVLVDPEDVDAITEELRRLLTDDAAHASLVDQARARPPRGWSDYADDLWEAFAR